MDVASDYGNLGHVPPEWAVTIGRNTPQSTTHGARVTPAHR